MHIILLLVLSCVLSLLLVILICDVGFVCRINFQRVFRDMPFCVPMMPEFLPLLLCHKRWNYKSSTNAPQGRPGSGTNPPAQEFCHSIIGAPGSEPPTSHPKRIPGLNPRYRGLVEESTPPRPPQRRIANARHSGRVARCAPAARLVPAEPCDKFPPHPQGVTSCRHPGGSAAGKLSA